MWFTLFSKIYSFKILVKIGKANKRIFRERHIYNFTHTNMKVMKAMIPIYVILWSLRHKSYDSSFKGRKLKLKFGLESMH